MLSFILKRIAIAIPTLFVIALLTFFAVQAIPGDVATIILGENASQEQIDALREELGLNLPLIQQFFNWIGGVVSGDLGKSLIYNQDVAQALFQRSVITLTISFVGVIVCSIIGVGLGMLGAIKGGRTDSALLSTTSVGLAIPNFWAAVILVYIFSVTLAWLPANGWTQFSDDPWRWFLGLILPVTALVIVPIATVSRQTRASFKSVLGKDFIRSLRAAGISSNRIIYKHALRNAAIPIVTIIGIQFVLLVGGAVVIEQVFALPGIGQLAIQAVTTRDIPIIQGVVLFVAAMVLITNLLLDLLYAWLNPKVRLA
ncbi:MAG: ABC transporter permease [Microbacteriaceae bacterium]